MLITFFAFAVGAIISFRDNDPWHFGTLDRALLTLFRMATFEDWTDVMYINMYGSANYGYDASTYEMLAEMGISQDEVKSSASPFAAALFFVSFIVTGAMIVLNLFVGVMLTGMEDAKKEQELDSRIQKEGADQIDLKEEFAKLDQHLQEFSKEMTQRLEVLNRLAEKQNGKSGST